MRRLFVLIVATCALAASPGAFAHNPLIVIGESIGPIRLGMAGEEVVKVFGRPLSTTRVHFASGGRGREDTYKKHGGAFRITYAHDVVVGIQTAARFYRTASGVGPGVPLAEADTLPGFRFDQCTAGYTRWSRRTGTFFVAYQRPETISHAMISRSRYFDC